MRVITESVAQLSRQYKRRKLMSAFTTFFFGQPAQRFPFVTRKTFNVGKFWLNICSQFLPLQQMQRIEQQKIIEIETIKLVKVKVTILKSLSGNECLTILLLIFGRIDIFTTKKVWFYIHRFFRLTISSGMGPQGGNCETCE